MIIRRNSACLVLFTFQILELLKKTYGGEKGGSAPGLPPCLNRVKDSIVLRNIADGFYEDLRTPEKLGNACIHFFEDAFTL